MDVLIEGHRYDGSEGPPLIGPSKSRVLSSVSAHLTCSEYGENAEECAENAHRCGPWFAEENEVREK